MTNVYSTPEKVQRKNRLFQIGLETLEDQGYSVERIPGSGKSSVRKVTKDGRSQTVCIRTTQDRTIAFPRLDDDSGWRTLDDVDMIVAVAVDDRDNPRNGVVHFLDGEDMRDRFNRTYEARIAAGRKIPIGRGVWLSLYREEADSPPNLVGAGAGLKNKPVATVPFGAAHKDDQPDPPSAKNGLSIAEAKRLLALSLGVDETNIKISVEA